MGVITFSVDIFTKMCILSLPKKTITKKEMIDLFFANVWFHHGLPRSIVSNKDTQFVGRFQTTLWEKMDT